LRVHFEWKIYRPDSVITDVIPLSPPEAQNMDPASAQLIIAAIGAVTGSIALLGDTLEAWRQRRLCKHLTQLRRHLIAIVETGEEIGLSLNTDTFQDDEEVSFLIRLLEEQATNVRNAVRSFFAVKDVLELQSDEVFELGSLLDQKGRAIKLLYEATQITKEQLDERLARVNELAQTQMHPYDVDVTEKDGQPTLVILTQGAKTTPDDNFSQLKDCVPKLTECIKQICRPVHIWQ